MEYDLDTCPKCGGVADNGFSRDVPPAPYYCSACMCEEELAATKDILNQTRDERDLFASQRNASNREIEKLHDELDKLQDQLTSYREVMAEMKDESERLAEQYHKMKCSREELHFKVEHYRAVMGQAAGALSIYAGSGGDYQRIDAKKALTALREALKEEK